MRPSSFRDFVGFCARIQTKGSPSKLVLVSRDFSRENSKNPPTPRSENSARCGTFRYFVHHALLCEPRKISRKSAFNLSFRGVYFLPNRQVFFFCTPLLYLYREISSSLYERLLCSEKATVEAYRF